MVTDEHYIYRCIELAKLGAGNVAPNPMVGAVLVFQDCIIGEGFHAKYGEAHAEVNCINSVKEADKILIENSVLYVSLEPCAHYGKTPPCADLIIKHKIKKVVIGCRDTYKEVAGRGIRKLEDAGVKVSVEILQKECIELNKRFFIFHQKQRPYIILKWAQTIDGRLANAPFIVNNNEALNHNLDSHSRLKISNQYTDRLVHKWRSEEAAILAGTNTALQDNPLLTTRLWQGRTPIRLIIDNNLRLPSTLKIFNEEAKTYIFNFHKQEVDSKNIFIKLEKEDYLKKLVKVLFNLNIQSVLIEGGAKLIQSFIDADLWDEARVICNRELAIGDGVSAPVLKKFKLIKQEEYVSDLVSYYEKFFQ